ncbi:MFS transporter [Streptomyces sp. NPDC018045]|uniref:MFS transporter n=1 Tax=Streptomyces sp. NPDC018045 TaxID=3365037 RepID=UPI0037B677F6
MDVLTRRWRRAARHLRRRTFASLEQRNYRLYFLGQGISSTGTWLQLIAENWLIIRLGGSGLALGIATALQFAPIAVFGAYAGVLVDRWNKRRLLLVTQSLSAMIAAAVGIVALTGTARIWMVWTAALLLGCVNAFDGPARQVFTVELVGIERVANAVALNNAVGVSARAVGPALGGLLIAALGIAPSFLLNAASYLIVLLTLTAMDSGQLRAVPAQPRQRGQVGAGLRYVRHRPALCTVLLMVAVIGILGTNFQLLLTLLAAETLHAGAALYGALMSCLGAGMLLGSLISAGRHHPTPRTAGLCSAALGLAYVFVALSPLLTLTFIGVAVMGTACGLFLATASATLHTATDDSMRGRVMALYTIAFLGTTPLGGPLIGSIAVHWSVTVALLASAASCLLAALLALGARADPPAAT